MRILRVLTESNLPLSRAEVARRADLNASGVRRSIEDLVDLGMVEHVGAGSRRPVQLRRDHPLAGSLVALFAAERHRFQDLLAALRSRSAALRPPPRAVWIQGAVARNEDRPGDPLIVGVLGAAGQVDENAERLRAATSELASRQDVLVEVRAFTPADLRADPRIREEIDDVLPVSGPPPLSILESADEEERPAAPTTHATLDRRSLALGEALAERLSQDPSIVDAARRYIRRRLDEASASEQKELREWDRILRSASLPRLRRLLTDPGDHATRLRQTLPFLDVLSQDEREAIIRRAEQ